MKVSRQAGAVWVSSSHTTASYSFDYHAIHTHRLALFNLQGNILKAMAAFWCFDQGLVRSPADENPIGVSRYYSKTISPDQAHARCDRVSAWVRFANMPQPDDYEGLPVCHPRRARPREPLSSAGVLTAREHWTVFSSCSLKPRTCCSSFRTEGPRSAPTSAPRRIPVCVRTSFGNGHRPPVA